MVKLKTKNDMPMLKAQATFCTPHLDPRLWQCHTSQASKSLWFPGPSSAEPKHISERSMELMTQHPPMRLNQPAVHTAMNSHTSSPGQA